MTPIIYKLKYLRKSHKKPDTYTSNAPVIVGDIIEIEADDLRHVSKIRKLIFGDQLVLSKSLDSNELAYLSAIKQGVLRKQPENHA